MAGTILTFETMLQALKETISALPDPRTGENTRFSFPEIVLSAFSMFFLQSPSFLEFQRQMQSDTSSSNATRLFGIQAIPSDNHIRTILDTIPSTALRSAFTAIHHQAASHGLYSRFIVELTDGRKLLPIAIDGTQFFSSSKVHCDHCLRRSSSKGQLSYAHQMVSPTIVSPHLNMSFALAPEFIRNEDGAEKQDYERAAAQRWVKHTGSTFSQHGAVILGDDLYCCQSFIEHMEAEELSYIIVCKEESHKYLYETIASLKASNDTESFTNTAWDGKEHRTTTITWIHDVPLRDSADSKQVNWLEYRITGKDGRRIYYNTFITDLTLTPKTVGDIARIGRARWKIENEHHNTLKTKGYHLEHNFGHGAQHLADTLASLNLLAFLMHTILELTDELYQQVRAKLVKRTTFFAHLDLVSNYFLFECWHDVLRCILSPKKRPPP